MWATQRQRREMMSKKLEGAVAPNWVTLIVFRLSAASDLRSSGANG
jgi:hypothetical protein